MEFQELVDAGDQSQDKTAVTDDVALCEDFYNNMLTTESAN